MDYRTLYRNSMEDPEGFWAKTAAELIWTKPWDKVIDDSDAPYYEWFAGGAPCGVSWYTTSMPWGAAWQVLSLQITMPKSPVRW